jgi:hypothetical protein
MMEGSVSIPSPTTSKSQVVNKSLLFRCRELSNTTEMGKKILRELGIDVSAGTAQAAGMINVEWLCKLCDHITIDLII